MGEIARRKLFDSEILPEFQGDVESWANELVLTLTRLFSLVALDSTQGTSTFQVVSTVPGATDLDEGQIVLYESGVTRKLYTKINGSLRYVALT